MKTYFIGLYKSHEVEWVKLHFINIHEPSYLNCFISRGCAWSEALHS